MSEYSDKFRDPSEQTKRRGKKADKLTLLMAQISELEPLVEFERSQNDQELRAIEELRKIANE